MFVSGTSSSASTQRVLSFVIYALTFLLSAVAAYISIRRVREIKPQVEWEMAQQGRQVGSSMPGHSLLRGGGDWSSSDESEEESDSSDSGHAAK